MILPEYLQTIFITKKPPEDGWPENFAVIMASNPMRSGERQEDAAAMMRLRKHRLPKGPERTSAFP